MDVNDGFVMSVLSVQGESRAEQVEDETSVFTVLEPMPSIEIGENKNTLFQVKNILCSNNLVRYFRTQIQRILNAELKWGRIKEDRGWGSVYIRMRFLPCSVIVPAPWHTKHSGPVPAFIPSYALQLSRRRSILEGTRS